MKDDDEIIVVTARIIDTVAYFDDIDKRPCEKCGEMTWLSTNWRGRKIDKIICYHCFKKENNKEKDFAVTEACIKDAVNVVKELNHMKETKKEIRKKLIKVMEEELGKKIDVIK